ncbi:YjaG family protein [Halomonas cupida]|uniref:YjaG family protein n=1 Tax=Halomonas TaxID=2745 RepID=UPI001A908B04|nr:YjaG family protein [Halomonas litopenaei]MBN8412056.1 YjaG family protein [Halomonas litopenaei]
MAKPGFHQRLQALSLRQQQGFMAALTERMLPNYALYADTSGHGDISGMRVILDLVWEQLTVKDARIDFDRQAEKLAELEPPADDDSFGARRALDAVVALSAILDTMRGDAPDAVLEVSRVSRAAVRGFIELTEGEDDAERLVQMVKTHPLMEDENDFQVAALEEAEAEPSKKQMKVLKKLGRNGGVSNLGLTLD